jgi:hypothetical protein
MIKRYNDFVKEEFVMGSQTETKPMPTTAPTREREIEKRPMPTRPSVIPSRKPGVEDAPLAYSDNEYVGDYIIKDLASKLGPDAILKGNSIKYKGFDINYYSETEKIHIGKNKFATADEALEFLKGKEEVKEDKLDPEFEAKNYKLAHRHKRVK